MSDRMTGSSKSGGDPSFHTNMGIDRQQPVSTETALWKKLDTKIENQQITEVANTKTTSCIYFLFVTYLFFSYRFLSNLNIATSYVLSYHLPMDHRY